MDTKILGSELGIIFGVIGNIVATVGVVLMNKYVYEQQGYRFMVTLSFFHFVVTAMGTRICMYLKLFNYKEAPLSGILPVAIGSLGSVAFMNLNLAFNSVGFYQISKLACIPVTLVIEYFMNGSKVPTKVQIALLVLLSGVGIATVSDVQLNFIGSVYAAIAVLFTVMGQIFTSTKQKDLQLDSMQLLHHSSPVIAIGMFLLIPAFDEVSGSDRSLVEYQYTPAVVVNILITCALAFAVNVTNYFVIGKTSPVTYQVVGHLKTCLILVLGFVVFKYKAEFKNVLGITIAVVGMIWYTELKRRAASAPKTDTTTHVRYTPLTDIKSEKH